MEARTQISARPDRVRGFAAPFLAAGVLVVLTACEVANPAYNPGVRRDGQAANPAGGSSDAAQGGASDGSSAMADAIPAPPDAETLRPDTAPPLPDAALPVPANLLQGLIAYFPLDERSGSVAADRVSGNQGVVENPDSSQVWRPGLIGGAARFVDSDGHAIRVPASPSLNGLTGTLTIAAWAYVEPTIAPLISIISRQMFDNTAEQYDLALEGGYPKLFMFDADLNTHTFTLSPTPVRLQTWVHLAATYNGTGMSVYIDGQWVVSWNVRARLQSDSKAIFIGSNINMGDQNRRETMNGLIDEAVFYNRALSPAEVDQLFRLRQSLVP